MKQPTAAAIQRACDLLNEQSPGGWSAANDAMTFTVQAFAKEIQRASDIAKTVDEILAGEGRKLGLSNTRDILQGLILSDPDADLLEQAREICAKDAERWDTYEGPQRYRSGDYDDHAVVRVALAALKSARDPS